MGKDVYKVGKASADLRDLDQHVKSVRKAREQPRGDKKR